MGASLRYQALGPLLSGEGSRAFLGLEIRNEQRASPVVLVWVPEAVARDPQARASVERETARASSLDHPNILRVSGIASLEEGLARVVEFADGETLRKVLSTVARLPAQFAARVVADACQGVHFAHMAGNDDGTPLLHGDLRPETLMVCFSGVTKVTGYGALLVAPRTFGPEGLSGRHLHIAPEQLLAGRELATLATDVYLLGSTLFECLTGAVPFQHAHDFEQAVLSQDVVFPPTVDVPDALKQVVRKAMSKKGKDRYATPLELREALERAVAYLADAKAFESYLTNFFPDGEPARAARRRVIDNGIADFARRQWETAPSTSEVTLPSTPVVAQSLGLSPKAPAEGIAASVAAIMPVEDGPPPPPSRPARSESPPASRRAARTTELEVEVDDDEPVRKPSRGKLYAVVGGLAVLALVVLALRPGEDRSPSDLAAAASNATATRWAADAGDSTSTTTAGTAESKVAGAPNSAAAGDARTQSALAVPAVAEGDQAEEASVKPASALAAVDPSLSASTPASVEEETIASTGLELVVEPPVEVELNGERLGRTPLRRELAPGRYRLKLSDKAHGILLSRSVLVKKRGMTREEIYLGKGTVTINAPPGALIAFDGKLAGKAPAKTEFELYEGNHRVSVAFSGARWQERFRLRQGERLHFDVTTE